jgi:hypothetical protein
MPTKASIYSDCNPQMAKVFESAGHPAKVLCVALDYAKAQHTALICNGVGDLLKGSFSVDNTPAGANQLLKQLRHCARERKIRLEHAFIGGEDCPEWRLDKGSISCGWVFAIAAAMGNFFELVAWFV